MEEIQEYNIFFLTSNNPLIELLMYSDIKLHNVDSLL